MGGLDGIGMGGLVGREVAVTPLDGGMVGLGLYVTVVVIGGGAVKSEESLVGEIVGGAGAGGRQRMGTGSRMERTAKRFFFS